MIRIKGWSEVFKEGVYDVVYVESDEALPMLLILDALEPKRFFGQVGGIACHHPLLQAKYSEAPEFTILDNVSTCSSGCFGSPLSEEVLANLRKRWPSNPWQIDPSRQADSMEAFIPVKNLITQELGWIVMGNNCD